MTRLVFVCAVGVLWASAAHAQDDARALFESGSAALEAHELERAVADLARSFQLAPRPGTAANLAVALREAGRPTEAVALFDRLLTGALGALSPDLEQALRAERDAAAALRVSLTLQSNIDADMTARIDAGEPFSLGPRQILERALDPGSHVVRAEAADHEPLEVRVQLSPGERERVELTPSSIRAGASLEVLAIDPAHTVEIVGVGSSTGRLRERVEPGEYVIRVTGPGGTSDRRVRLDPGDRRRITLEAPGESIVESPWFWIVGALVVLGGAGAAVGLILTNPQREVTPVPADSVFGTVRALRFGD